MKGTPEEHEAKMPCAEGDEEMGGAEVKPTAGESVLGSREATPELCGEHNERFESEQQIGEEKQYEPVAVLPLRELSVLRALNFMLSLLIEYAWQKMGLLANPITGKIERDIEEARFAIDTIAVLIEHIKPKLGEREYDQLRQTLTTLRINFVEQVSKSDTHS